MLDYLQKFNKLPKELRNKISTSAVIFAINELEKKYKINLAAVVMRIMIKEFTVNSLAEYFVKEFNLEQQNAEQLTNELKEKVLFDVADYLRIKLEDKDKKIKDEKMLRIANDRVIQAMPSFQKLENFFSDEDEKEIKELAQKIKDDKKDNLYNENINGKLDKIIEQAQINFGSEDLALRFRNILKIYLTKVRDKIDTQQTLIKPMDIGGLGFDKESANRVLKIADNVVKIFDVKLKKNIEAPELKKEKIVNAKKMIERDVSYNLNNLKKKDNKKPKKEILKELDLGHLLAPPPPKLYQDNKVSFFTSKKKPKIQQTNDKTEKIKHKISDEDITDKQKIISQTQRIKQIDARKTDVITGKIKMDDVKFKPKVMSPIDELRYMDLISFRRLSPDVRGITEKIKEKIKLLEEESYTKRSSGIRAWRMCPVNKLYLDIGQISISKNKAIDAIIEERKSNHQDCLNIKEFEAIADLNRDLRF